MNPTQTTAQTGPTATPRTDAAKWIETNEANAVVLAAFSRQLERENAELRGACEAALLELEANKVAMVGPEWASQRTMTGGALLVVARALANTGTHRKC